jgi:cell division protein FtsL
MNTNSPSKPAAGTGSFARKGEARAGMGSGSAGGGVGPRRHVIRLYLTAMLLLGLMFTVYIWQSTKMIEIKIRLKEFERQIESLDTGNAVLRAEISKLQSLTRIEKVAKEDLRMVVPQNVMYLPMEVPPNAPTSPGRTVPGPSLGTQAGPDSTIATRP